MLRQLSEGILESSRCLRMDEMRASQSTPAALDIASASFSRLNPIQLFRRVVESIQVYAAGSIVRAGEHGCAETRGDDRKPDRRAETADRCCRSRAGQRVHRRRLHRQPHGSPGPARAAEGFEGRRLRRDLFPRGRPYCARRDLPDDHHRRDAAATRRTLSSTASNTSTSRRTSSP